jgi:hypothetical protein
LLSETRDRDSERQGGRKDNDNATGQEKFPDCFFCLEAFQILKRHLIFSPSEALFVAMVCGFEI